MNDNTQGRSKTLRRLIVSLLLVGVMTIGGCALLIWLDDNPARSGSEFVTDLADTNDLVLFCGNGADADFIGSNDTPWWEWTLLSNRAVDEVAVLLGAELESQGFVVRPGIEQAASPDAITMKGINSGQLEVTVRVGGEVEPRNCFPNFGDVITDVDPDLFEVTAVMMFRSEAETRDT